jgi:hypothetical protein
MVVKGTHVSVKERTFLYMGRVHHIEAVWFAEQALLSSLMRKILGTQQPLGSILSHAVYMDLV